jgi:hypothetical protein
VPGGVNGPGNPDGLFGGLIENLTAGHFGDCFPDVVQLVTPLAAILQMLLHRFTLSRGEQPPDKIKATLIGEMTIH